MQWLVSINTVFAHTYAHFKWKKNINTHVHQFLYIVQRIKVVRRILLKGSSFNKSFHIFVILSRFWFDSSSRDLWAWQPVVQDRTGQFSACVAPCHRASLARGPNRGMESFSVAEVQVKRQGTVCFVEWLDIHIYQPVKYAKRIRMQFVNHQICS